MLTKRTVLDRDGVTIEEVACRHEPGRGHEIERSSGYEVVFVRRGCFVRNVDGIQSLLDPTLAYCASPGQEQRFDHPHADGDDCTTVQLDEALAASIWGQDQPLPRGPLPIPPKLDLEHRLLLAAGRRAADSHELAERAITLAADALGQVAPRAVEGGQPATVRARRALVDAAREALVAEPGCSLPQLARALAVSPHHLSRIFRAATGHTIARHRMRLRARAALERLAGGERDLARLAADLGLADQSHLYRVLRTETGRAPSALRHALSSD